MLSVTDNSRGARGDVTAVAAESPNSEANLDRYGESCRPVHLAQSIGPKPEADACRPKVWLMERPRQRGPARFWTRPIATRRFA